MTRFMGNHHNRLDAKGRVSIPAPFRAELRDAAAEGAPASVVLRPSHTQRCIEGWPAAEFHQHGQRMEALAPFSQEQADLTLLFYGSATELVPDKDGRVVLPDGLAARAHLSDEIVFVGMRDHFQIWEPGRLEKRREEAEQRAQDRGFTLPARPQ